MTVSNKVPHDALSDVWPVPNHNADVVSNTTVADGRHSASWQKSGVVPRENSQRNGSHHTRRLFLDKTQAGNESRRGIGAEGRRQTNC